MELIHEYSEAAEAYIAQGMLRNNGIEAEVLPGDLSGIFPGVAPTQLYVAEKDAAKARELLASH